MLLSSLPRSPRAAATLGLALALSLSACNDSGDGAAPVQGPSAASFPSSGYTLLAGVPASQVASTQPTVVGTAEQWSVSPALPAGLALNNTTGAITGTPDAPAERAPYTITASGLGASVQTVVQLGVARPVRQTVLAGTDGTLSVFTVDPATGRLTPQTKLSPNLDGVQALAPSPLDSVLYALVSAGTSGAPALVTLRLVPAGGVAILDQQPVGPGMTELALAADGSLLAVADPASGEVRAYPVDPDTALPGTPSSLSPSSDVGQLAVHPDGRFVLLTSVGDTTLHVLAVDEATGELSVAQAQPLNGALPAGLALAPDGRFTYLSIANFGFVLGFALDQDTGALVAVNNQTVGTSPGALRMQPAGLNLLVTDDAEQVLRVLPRSADTGELDPPRNPLDVGPGPVARYDESGLILWTVNDEGVVGTFQVNAGNGALTRGPDFPAGAGIAGVAPVAGDGPLVRSVGRLYVVNETSATVTVYGPEGPDGELVQLGVGVPTGVAPTAAALHPMGRALAVTGSGDNSITLVQLTGNGDPGAVATYSPAGPEPTDLAFSPSGKQLFVTRAASAEVAVLDVDLPNLTLVPQDTLVLGGRPEHLALSPDGQWLVVSDTQGARLVTVRVQAGGFVGAPQSLDAGGQPGPPQFLADGRGLLVPLTDQNAVRGYELDGASGVLAASGPAVTVGAQPVALALDRSGRWAYGALLAGLGTGGVRVCDLDEAARSVSIRNVVASSAPRAVLLSPDQSELFVANGDLGAVSRFELGPNGGLVPAGELATDTLPRDLVLSTRYE